MSFWIKFLGSDVFLDHPIQALKIQKNLGLSVSLSHSKLFRTRLWIGGCFPVLMICSDLEGTAGKERMQRRGCLKKPTLASGELSSDPRIQPPKVSKQPLAATNTADEFEDKPGHKVHSHSPGMLDYLSSLLLFSRLDRASPSTVRYQRRGTLRHQRSGTLTESLSCVGGTLLLLLFLCAESTEVNTE